MSSASTTRVVVLISGSGSNLQALIDGQSSAGLPIEIAAVISNRPNVKGLERAAQAGIEAITLDHKGFESREAFDAALAEHIDSYRPDLIVLAGFMRILTPAFTQRYCGRMLNIHPSLLPKYQGLNTHQRALDAGDSEHGVTVHFVTAELDGGPAAIQAVVPILAGDDASILASRVQAQEHVIYPMAVQWFAEGKLTMADNKALLDGEPLPASGYQVRTDNA
ncbi:phosphoribosylglycinamide formyltransferase [Gilvimarinus sp. SDUM040013]|uniref:Phosphoribosylglycinamide formyltransferase n=1 Tax=Gilvimarinus gilvus TaxID=3058038 RepID=A0ABU4RYX9_9GAMM|nr:phosphoribosylglycinamide formyltransferase [Gilvimarinus sp. SDUM040013]MDO3384557.1 phosphoribosylglycinamide formyltransferase [Gilvimarinus sp. SDUM040013]MDX6850107.1 phosphoribosylglycinamide formyltransferase [Gilvimarinus sp. SDUM040013]